MTVRFEKCKFNLSVIGWLFLVAGVFSLLNCLYSPRDSPYFYREYLNFIGISMTEDAFGSKFSISGRAGTLRAPSREILDMPQHMRGDGVIVLVPIYTPTAYRQLELAVALARSKNAPQVIIIPFTDSDDVAKLGGNPEAVLYRDSVWIHATNGRVSRFIYGDISAGTLSEFGK